MSTTRGNLDSKVALYAESVPPDDLKKQQLYCNVPACPSSSPPTSPGRPDDSPPITPDYYNNNDPRESYLQPVQGEPEVVGAPSRRKPPPPIEVQDDDDRSRSENRSIRPLPRQPYDVPRPQPTDTNRLCPEEEVRLPLNQNGSSRSRDRSNRNLQQAGVVPLSEECGGNHEADDNQSDPHALQYIVNQTPPWYLCIFLGFQHFLVMFGATVSNPLVMAPFLCIADDDYEAKSQLMGTILVCSGIATLLQATLGSRLPIVQGGTFTFVTPSIALLSLPQWKFPTDSDSSIATTTGTVTTVTDTIATASMAMSNATDAEPIWHSRIREVQGAIMVASLFQVFIGFSGLLGFIMRWIGPLAIAPTIALAGLALFDVATLYASKQWWITLVTVILIAMFSQYTKNIGVPCCRYEKNHGFVRITFPLFRLFPIILAISITWLLCVILSLAGVNLINSEQTSKATIGIDVLREAAWFRVPYPGQWGMPTVSAAGVFGLLAGVLASMLESLGDYYACARLSQAPPPPMHAINRGIGIEGLGCVIAGAFGSGSGTTSYSENIGAIGITKVASRSVIQVAAVMMLIFGVFGKFAALFVTIPDPVIGGVFIVMFGMVAAVGLSNLQFVDLNSSRNLFIIGFSLFFGLALPKFIKENPDSVATGNAVLDQIVAVLLQTNMFVGGISGFVLDNTIPGTDEERGLIKWRQLLIRKRKKSRRGLDEAYYKQQQTIYEIVPITNILKKWSWTRYIPFLPTFDESIFKVKNRFHKLGKKKKVPTATLR